MSEYPLADYAYYIEYNGERCGIIVACPNCGVKFSAWFISGLTAKWREVFPNRPVWEHSGETLETLSLTPSFLFIGHCHSWIRNGVLCVDSEFTCPAWG